MRAGYLGSFDSSNCISDIHGAKQQHYFNRSYNKQVVADERYYRLIEELKILFAHSYGHKSQLEKDIYKNNGNIILADNASSISIFLYNNIFNNDFVCNEQFVQQFVDLIMNQNPEDEVYIRVYSGKSITCIHNYVSFKKIRNYIMNFIKKLEKM